MYFFEFMLGVVLVTTVAGVINNYMKYKLENKENLDVINERVQKLEQLEERIKTLETIVTDQNYDLDQKIKSL